MMRPIAVAVAPKAASNLTALTNKPGVALSWNDNSANETGFVVQRATATAPSTWTTVTTVQSTPAQGAANSRTVTYLDTATTKNTSYLYRVTATNVVGDLTTYAAPAAGYPHVNVDSDPVTLAKAVTAG